MGSILLSYGGVRVKIYCLEHSHADGDMAD